MKLWEFRALTKFSTLAISPKCCTLYKQINCCTVGFVYYVCDGPLQAHSIQNVNKMVWGRPKRYAIQILFNRPCKNNSNTICIPCSQHTLPERLRPLRHHFYSIPFWTAQNHLNTVDSVFAIRRLLGDIGTLQT